MKVKEESEKVGLSTPDLPVHPQLPEFTQTHIHRVSDAIQPSHPRSTPALEGQGFSHWTTREVSRAVTALKPTKCTSAAPSDARRPLPVVEVAGHRLVEPAGLEPGRCGR